MAETFARLASRLAAMDTRRLVGFSLAEARREVPGLTVLYADVGSRFGLERFREEGGYCQDTGIAEQGMLGVAAGLCAEGIPTVAVTYGPFLAGRAFDQIRANAGEMGLPLVMIGSPSGLSGGGLGPLSSCIDDIALLRSVPGLAVISPADGIETVKSVRAALRRSGPTYIRMTGRKMPVVYGEDYDFRIGEAERLREGDRCVIVATGAIVSSVLAARDRLAGCPTRDGRTVMKGLTGVNGSVGVNGPAGVSGSTVVNDPVGVNGSATGGPARDGSKESGKLMDDPARGGRAAHARMAVLNMHTVKPLDVSALEEYMDYKIMITVEEHSLCGGLGDAVAAYLAGRPRHPRLVRLGIPDRYFVADHYEELLRESGLAEEQLYRQFSSLANEVA